MIIEKGTTVDLDGIDQLYLQTTTYLQEHINYPSWKKGIYPAREDAILGINEGGLYVVKDENKIIGSFILRHKPEKGYAGVDWHLDLDYKDILVIYTLVIHPDYHRCGIGKKVIDFIIDLCRKEGIKALRLDVTSDNLPAVKLYKKCGFQYIDSVDLGYSLFGLDEFELYQMIL